MEIPSVLVSIPIDSTLDMAFLFFLISQTLKALLAFSTFLTFLLPFLSQPSLVLV